MSFLFHFCLLLKVVSSLLLWLFSMLHFFRCKISLSLKVLSKSMKKYINEWTTTTLRFIILCPLLHTKSLINKLQSAILINTASSTSHLESHSSKGTLQWCLGWGNGPGEKRFSSHSQTIKLFSSFWFSEKNTLSYIVIFILRKSVIRNLILTGDSFFFPVAE